MSAGQFVPPQSCVHFILEISAVMALTIEYDIAKPLAMLRSYTPVSRHFILLDFPIQLVLTVCSFTKIVPTTILSICISVIDGVHRPLTFHVEPDNTCRSYPNPV